MAHEIETRNGKASMIYVGETPWHGLGTRLTVAPSSTAEAIKLAGLDWQIGLERAQLADGTLLDRFAVVRDVDRAVLGVVGMDWEPVQNSKAFEPFDPFVRTGAATIETAGSLRGGRRVWMLAKLNRADSVIVPKSDDRVAKYLLVAIGHDGTLAFRIGYTPIRVVCQNTLSVALNRGEATHVRLMHLSGVNKAIDNVTAAIEAIDARFEEAADMFRALAARQIHNEAELRTYVEAVYNIGKKPAAQRTGAELLGDLLAKPANLPKAGALDVDQGGMTKETRSRIMDEVAHLFTNGKGNDLPGVRGTAYAAYNAVTEHLTWHRGGAVKAQDSRLENLWMSSAGPQALALPVAIEQFVKGKGN
jgi:phage/plasmid-like protein (TIGR03299 family)